MKNRFYIAVFISIYLMLFTSNAFCQVYLVQVLPVSGDLKSKIVDIVSGRTDFPTKHEWLGFDEDTVKVLKAIAQDVQQWPSRRALAIDALGYFQTKSVKSFLLKLYKYSSGKTGVFLRCRILLALTNAFGSDVIGFIKKHLADEDIFIRETAITALANIGGAEEMNLLKSRLNYETNKMLKNKIRKILQK